MINRHTTFFVDKVKPIDFCGKTIMWQMDMKGAYEEPFETKPTIGEHDFNECKACQITLKKLTKQLRGKFEGVAPKKGFPFCCSHHVNLIKRKEFNLSSFSKAPEMVASKVIYTNQHISNNYNTENYYKEITDYVDYTIESLGQMPDGCGEPLYLSDYLFCVADLLKKNIEIPEERKSRLLEYLEAFNTPKETHDTNMNILLNTYQKWLSEFPFEINSYFGELRTHFEKQLPIFNGKPEINKYSGIASIKLHTRSSLIEYLINTTNSLLTQLNGLTLYEKGLITDPNKIKLELAINNRKLELKEGYLNNSKDEEQRYRRILKKWFKDEKKFIDEISPLINNIPTIQKLSDNDFIKGDFKLVLTFHGTDPKEYEVIKDNEKRVFSFKQYFNLYLQNWETIIDGQTQKKDKLQAVNNAVLELQKDRHDEGHKEIIVFFDKTIEQLKNIEEYITKTDYDIEPKENEVSSPEPENNIIHSTIEDWLFPFKEEKILTETNYNNLVTTLKHFFEEGSFPNKIEKINVQKVNKKRFAWALNEIYKACMNNNESLSIEYLRFAHENISIFTEVAFDETNYLSSNLYKYFTTKTL